MILNNPTVKKILDKGTVRKRVQTILLNDLKKFGFNKAFLTRKYKTIDEMKQSVPGIVLAESVSNSRLIIGRETLTLKPGDVYTMPLDFYIKGFTNGELFFLKPYKKRFSECFRRYLGDDLSGKKLLMWRVGGLGDLIFTQPLVRFLKEKYPSVYITFATSPENKFLFKTWPKGLIDNIATIPFKMDLLSEHDYHLTFEGAIERCNESEKVNCYDIFKKVANVDFNVEDYRPVLHLDQEEVDKFKDIVPENTILFQIRASSPLRMMPTYKWVILAKQLSDLGYNVAIIDSQDRHAMYEDYFIKRYSLENKVVNLAKFSQNISDGIHILANCKAFIGIDSSFTHIAPALNIPTVGIYGPFLGDLRMRYYKNCDWVDANKYYDNICGKYPCFFHQDASNDCPFFVKQQPVGCLSSIPEGEIINKLIKLLSSENEKR